MLRDAGGIKGCRNKGCGRRERGSEGGEVRDVGVGDRRIRDVRIRYG